MGRGGRCGATMRIDEMDTELLEQIEQQHAALVAVLARIPASAATGKRILGEWTARELLAHLIGWQLLACEVLRTVHDGTPAPAASEENVFNALNVARWGQAGWDDLQRLFSMGNGALLATARCLNATAWQDPRVPGWLRGSTINHYRIHAPDFERAI